MRNWRKNREKRRRGGRGEKKEFFPAVKVPRQCPLVPLVKAG
jgi:hypothetical protein